MTLLAQRSTAAELMDDLQCHGEVVDQTLRELEVINRLLGGDRVTIDGVRRLLHDRPGQGPIVIADLGCGGGDMAAKLCEWGRARNLELKVLGIDANPHIVSYAAKRFGKLKGVDFETVNVWSPDFQKKTFDILTATLFIHHFTDEELVSLFRSLKRQARIGIVINDIHRHFFSFHSIRFLTALFSRSHMVRYDAPLSVLRAFKRRELKEILENAGITKYTLRWRWAFRWQLVIR